MVNKTNSGWFNKGRHYGETEQDQDMDFVNNLDLTFNFLIWQIRITGAPTSV